MAVHFRIPSEVNHDDLTGHIILVGGVVWNEITGRLSNMAKLPVKQVEHPDLDSGEIFVAEADGAEQELWPQWADAAKTLLSEDVGLLARVPNPLNSSRTLTICNGIHSRGVYGAVRTLTDTHLRDPNERYIAANFGDATSFAILMSVQVIKNKTITPRLQHQRGRALQVVAGHRGGRSRLALPPRRSRRCGARTGRVTASAAPVPAGPQAGATRPPGRPGMPGSRARRSAGRRRPGGR